MIHKEQNSFGIDVTKESMDKLKKKSHSKKCFDSYIRSSCFFLASNSSCVKIPTFIISFNLINPSVGIDDVVGGGSDSFLCSLFLFSNN